MGKNGFTVSLGSKEYFTSLIAINNNLELKQPSLVCNGLQHKFFAEGFCDCLKVPCKGNIINLSIYIINVNFKVYSVILAAHEISDKKLIYQRT